MATFLLETRLSLNSYPLASQCTNVVPVSHVIVKREVKVEPKVKVGTHGNIFFSRSFLYLCSHTFSLLFLFFFSCFPIKQYAHNNNTFYLLVFTLIARATPIKKFLTFVDYFLIHSHNYFVEL